MKVLVSLFFYLFLLADLAAEYPQLRCLKNTDLLFVQLQKDIESYYKAQARFNELYLPTLTFFEYKIKPDDTLFSIASDVNLPYDTIATLNCLSIQSDFSKHDKIIIPNMPGIFVPSQPETQLEEVMYSIRQSRLTEAQLVTVFFPGKTKKMLFFKGDKYFTIERAYFLKFLFRFPLNKILITSSYGYRTDPFTKQTAFHGGIDLAAVYGEAVYAARNGWVSECGYNDILGNYIIVNHEQNYQTVYGHLQKILVNKGQKVNTYTMLGTIGMTGKTTGPHLHFEIRKNSKTVDPGSLLF